MVTLCGKASGAGWLHTLECHLKTGAAAFAWQATPITIVVLGELTHECQAEVNAAVAVLAQADRTVEGLEDAFPLMRGDPRSPIRIHATSRYWNTSKATMAPASVGKEGGISSGGVRP